MKIYIALGVLLATCVVAWALSFPDDPIRQYDPFWEMTLPEVSFTNATVDEIARTLEREYAAHVDDRTPQQLNFLIHPSCSNIHVSATIASNTVGGILELLYAMYGIEHSQPSGHQILLSHGPQGPMVNRVYEVLSVFPSDPPDDYDATAYFSRFGIAFPEGASAVYIPALGKLVVCNTPANLTVLEKALSILNVVPYQVETTLRLIRITDAKLAQCTNSAPTNIEFNSILTESDTLLQMTALTATGNTSSNTLRVASAASKNKEAREGYAILVVTPLLETAGQYLSIQLHTSIGVPLPDQQFVEYSADTTLTLHKAATIMFNLSSPAMLKDDSDPLFLAISVRLVDLITDPTSERDWSIVERILKQH